MMANETDIQITDAELEIMKVLWKEGEIPSIKIIENLEANGDKCNKNTIRTLLMRLVDKGAVTVKKITPQVYLYEAAISEEQYREQANKSFLNKVYDGSVGMLLTSFIADESLTKKDIERLIAKLESIKTGDDV